MTHSEVKTLFIKWHQAEYPDRRIFNNPTGWAKYGRQYVPYGIPPPLHGKHKKAGGGGSDLITLAPGMIARFYEIKTLKDTIRPNQKWFADWVISMQGEYYIIKEDGMDERGFIITRY